MSCQEERFKEYTRGSIKRKLWLHECKIFYCKVFVDSCFSKLVSVSVFRITHNISCKLKLTGALDHMKL